MAARSRVEGFSDLSTYIFTELIGRRSNQVGETVLANGQVIVNAEEDANTSMPSVTVTAQGSFDLPVGTFDQLLVGYTDRNRTTTVIKGYHGDEQPVEIVDEASRRTALKKIWRLVYESSRS